MHIPKAQLTPAKPMKDKLLYIPDPILVSLPATGNGYYYCWFLTSVPSYRTRKLRPRDRLLQRHTAKCWQSQDSNPSFQTLTSHVLSLTPHRLPTAGQDSEALLRSLESVTMGQTPVHTFSDGPTCLERPHIFLHICACTHTHTYTHTQCSWSVCCVPDTDLESLGS